MAAKEIVASVFGRSTEQNGASALDREGAYNILLRIVCKLFYGCFI